MTTSPDVPGPEPTRPADHQEELPDDRSAEQVDAEQPDHTPPSAASPHESGG
jgi:hypothetical protein